VDGDTVVYMPHCDLWLFETLLQHNWSHDKLNSLIIFGNDMGRYDDIIPSDIFAEKWPCLSRIIPFLQHYQLPAVMLEAHAFFSLSIQVIRLDKEPIQQVHPPEDLKQIGRRKKRMSPKPPRTILFPTDEAFWVLPENPAPGPLPEVS